MINQVCYYNHLMIDLWAYSNNLPLALRPITYISNTKRLSVTIMLLLCQRLGQGINNVIICMYSAYLYIPSIDNLSNKMVAPKYMFGSLVRSGFFSLCNGSIVITSEFYSI